MKNRLIIGMFFTFFVFTGQFSYGQIWKKVQKKLEDKIDKKVDDVLAGREEHNTMSTGSGNASLPNVEKIYSFSAGDSIIFADNFSADPVGRMAKHWASSGGGSVAIIDGMPGQWLALAPYTSYRIDSLLTLPEIFTIEFDLATRSMEAADIGSMSFGFGRDNSSRSYIMDAYNDNAITNTQLHFHNKEITNSSSDTKIYNPIKFPLGDFSNGILHVAIAVEGENMRVYVNKSKLLDTRMFNKDAIKYFYLSAPFDYKSDAEVFFGNFAIAH